MAVIEAMVEKTKKMKEENCDLYALIYMRGWLKGVVDDLDNLKSATIIQYTIKGRFMSR